MAIYDDLVKAGLLGPTDQRDAALMGLFQLGSQIGARGAPRLSPTAPALDLAGPMKAYQQSLTGAMTRGALARKLKQEADVKAAFSPRPVDEARARVLASRGADRLGAMSISDDPGAYQDDLNAWNERYTENLMPRARATTTTPEILSGVPASVRPFYQQMAEAGLGKEALTSMGTLIAAQHKYRKPEYHNVLVGDETRPRYVDTAEVDRLINSGLNVSKFTQPLIQHNAPDAMSKWGVGELVRASENAALAGQKLFRLNEMKNLIATGVPTGPLSKMSLGIRKIFQGFGWSNPNIPLQTAINSLGSQMALDQHGPGMGPMTDADFKIYASIVGGLENSPAGNALVMMRMQREYMGQEIYAEVIREQANNPDIGPSKINARKAWLETTRRLNEKIGPLIMQFEKEDEVTDAHIGRFVHIKSTGRTFLVEK